MANSCFSTFMAEKKTTKAPKKTKASKSKKTTKAPKKTKASKSKKTTKAPKKTKASKSKKQKKEETFDDMGIVIVEDDLSIDKEKVNEERKAYLEEARSQEAFD